MTMLMAAATGPTTAMTRRVMVASGAAAADERDAALAPPRMAVPMAWRSTPPVGRALPTPYAPMGSPSMAAGAKAAATAAAPARVPTS